ncbi:hypothetical protein [Marinomonas sp. ef1]|nr:hypothetical protein [Marinomonas sp. ef1]
MTSLIVAITALVSVLGIAVFVWSMISTRNKYYKEFMGRKDK